MASDEVTLVFFPPVITLNADKSSVHYLDHNQRTTKEPYRKSGMDCQLKVILNNFLIEQVKSYTYLGITITSHLSFNRHVKGIFAKSANIWSI